MQAAKNGHFVPGDPSRRIFDRMPTSWRELQNHVAQAFVEMGCRVASPAKVSLQRGDVEVDVLVRDQTTIPHSTFVCECKYWCRPVSKSIVHGFRTVVGELGANRGIIVSRRGFQSGAREAATFTNIDLLTWSEFEALYFSRWLYVVTRRLNPYFAFAHQLMDPNDERLWKLRPWTEELHSEWDRICKRYPIINLWSFFLWESKVGFDKIPGFGFTDEGVLSKGGKPVVLDTYRKIVDAAPALCRAARRDLEQFWQIEGIGSLGLAERLGPMLNVRRAS